MKSWKLCSLILACAVFAGCTSTSRSISHSSFREEDSAVRDGHSDGASDSAFEYRGELSEFDVLGITRGEITSEIEIRRALENSKPVKLRPGSSILLIQSGALFPDGPMVTELRKHFTVVPFSGIPAVRKTSGGSLRTESSDPEGYSKTLRLTAARGGTELILCYWGMLESESSRLATKTVSWVPLFNWVIPDETQHMRIRLKVALIDVRTGNWSVFSAKPFEDTRSSAPRKRSTADQKLVESLKQRAYEATVEDLIHSELAMKEN